MIYVYNQCICINMYSYVLMFINMYKYVLTCITMCDLCIYIYIHIIRDPFLSCQAKMFPRKRWSNLIPCFFFVSCVSCVSWVISASMSCVSWDDVIKTHLVIHDLLKDNIDVCVFPKVKQLNSHLWSD